MISNVEVLSALVELDKSFEYPVCHSFQEIVDELDLKSPDYMQLEHLLWQLVQKKSIGKSGPDPNYQHCMFFRIQQ